MSTLVVVTSNAAIAASALQIQLALGRFSRSDFGNIDVHDREANLHSQVTGQGRVMGVYEFLTVTLWIIAENGITTVLLPEDY